MQRKTIFQRLRRVGLPWHHKHKQLRPSWVLLWFSDEETVKATEKKADLECEDHEVCGVTNETVGREQLGPFGCTTCLSGVTVLATEPTVKSDWGSLAASRCAEPRRRWVLDVVLQVCGATFQPRDAKISTRTTSCSESARVRCEWCERALRTHDIWNNCLFCPATCSHRSVHVTPPSAWHQRLARSFLCVFSRSVVQILALMLAICKCNIGGWCSS